MDRAPFIPLNRIIFYSVWAGAIPSKFGDCKYNFDEERVKDRLEVNSSYIVLFQYHIGYAYCIVSTKISGKICVLFNKEN